MVNISEDLWGEFSVYLFVDRKLSTNRSSKGALLSRFKTLCAFFQDKEWNRDTFNSFIASLQEHNYSMSYINNFIKMGKHLDYFLKTNFLQDYTYFKVPRSRVKETLTFEEIQRLAECPMKYRVNPKEINLRHQAMILLLGCTGMRIGELLNLEWDDLHLVGELPTVTLRETKNGEDRTNIVTLQLWCIINQLPKKGPKVFGLSSDWSFKADLKSRAKKCGINKNIYPHLFRSSFITEMRRKGATYEAIAPITGHKDINVLKNHYDQVNLGDIERTLYTYHQFFKQDQTVEMLNKRGREFLENLIDTTKFNYNFKVYIK